MADIELTSGQRRLLTALVDEFRDGESPVSAVDLAAVLDREPGTLRNRMTELRLLDLVESVKGPGGGYRPTETAYEVLDRPQLSDPETVTIARGYDRVDATVNSIDFTTVRDSERCRARVRFRQSVREFAAGEEIAIGPTPRLGLVLGGVVDAVSGDENTVIVDVKLLEAPFRRDGPDTA